MLTLLSLAVAAVPGVFAWWTGTVVGSEPESESMVPRPRRPWIKPAGLCPAQAGVPRGTHRLMDAYRIVVVHEQKPSLRRGRRRNRPASLGAP
jgi:hypothetical protein